MRERGVSSKERCEKVCARAGAGFLYVHARGGGGGGARVCTHIYTYICTRVCSTHQRVRQGKNVYTAAHTGTHIYIAEGQTDSRRSPRSIIQPSWRGVGGETRRLLPLSTTPLSCVSTSIACLLLLLLLLRRG